MSTKKSNQWECKTCAKKYINFISFNIHMKSKHQRNIKENFQFKANFTEEQKCQLQDKIIVLLGEIGQKTIEQSKKCQLTTIKTKRVNNSQKLDFLDKNLIVRNPYESEINPQKQFPEFNQKQNHNKVLFEQIREQINKVYSELIAEKSKWQYRDSLLDDDNSEEQFSLMNISLLCKNLKKKEIEVTFPQVSIFLLWLSKTCTSFSWKFFVKLIMLVYTSYQLFLSEKKQRKCLKNWMQFTKQQKTYKQLDLNKKQLKITDSDEQKFILLYFKWVQYFDLLPINNSSQQGELK